MINDMEILRDRLNKMISLEDARQHFDEILNISQKLDKLVFISQTIMNKRKQTIQ